MLTQIIARVRADEFQFLWEKLELFHVVALVKKNEEIQNSIVINPFLSIHR